MDLRFVRNQFRISTNSIGRIVRGGRMRGKECRDRVVACGTFGFVEGALEPEPRLGVGRPSYARDRSCLDMEPVGTSFSVVAVVVESVVECVVVVVPNSHS